MTKKLKTEQDRAAHPSTAHSRNVPAGAHQLERNLYIIMKLNAEFSAKVHIAKHVVEKYVHDFDAVMLDAGSTAEFIAMEMLKKRQYLSIMTNNMGAYAAYAAYTRHGYANSPEESSPADPRPAISSNELQISGGRYVDMYESLLGEQALEAFSRFTPNLVIIGVSGLRVREGLFCHGGEESAIKALLCAKTTDLRIVAADWSKIGRRDAHAFADVEKLNAQARHAVVVTNQPSRDQDPELVQEFDSQVRQLKDRGIQVDVLPVKGYPEADTSGAAS